MAENGEILSILVVDDDSANRDSLSTVFEREGFSVNTAASAELAIEKCRKHHFDVVLTDLMMPGMNGIELIQALAAVAPDAEVVMMTAFGSVDTAVKAMREGAFDFVEKPLKRAQIVKTIRQAGAHHALVSENRELKSELSTLKARKVIGNAPPLRHALDMATQVAPTSANVLILGESGTGKEMVARHIHECSGRKNFVAVNLAALPETIIESELFGHEKGAFTGAHARREGRIAQAENGTLFLDEIGELPPTIQVKLLRVLQEGEYEPLGGTTRKATFRLIAATNRDLKDAVTAGEFREDLYYRLNVIAITSPPLRERSTDIPLLANYFLERYGRRNNKNDLVLTENALQKLSEYHWPGNVRELENAMERAVVLCRDNTIDVDQLPETISNAEARHGQGFAFPLGTPLIEIERKVILDTLAHTNDDKQLASKLLGISARTIYRKLESERDE